MDMSVNAHEKSPNGRLLVCWFTGTTALLKGQGLCYVWDSGDAALVDGRRSNRVALPTILNARYFAGVVARPRSAKPGGQMVELWAPGSFCEVLSKSSTTIGDGVLTCEAGGAYAGYFRDKGFEGEGTCVPLQTIDRGTDAGPCFAKLQEGPPSGLVENVVANTDGLLDGGATTFMVGGVSYLDTDISTGGNATATLADGIVPGMRKAFVAREAQTNDVVVAVDSGIDGHASADGTGALGTITLDADLEEITLNWDAFDTNGVWVTQHAVGVTLG